MCWLYKLVSPFYEKNRIPFCCVGCKYAKNNMCAKGIMGTLKMKRFYVETDKTQFFIIPTFGVAKTVEGYYIAFAFLYFKFSIRIN